MKKIPAVLSPEVAAAGGVVAAGVAPRVAAHAERDAEAPLNVLVEHGATTPQPEAMKRPSKD